MSDLVPLGCVGRPHGYRGAFLAQRHTGPDSALAHVRKVWVGPSPEQATPYFIRKASYMPKGWRLELEEWDTEDQPKEHRFHWIYVPRSELPPPEEGEYYLSDLQECVAVRAEDGAVLGRFTGLEPAASPGVGPDRWWFDVDGKSVGVPAVAPYIDGVDIANRRIVLSRIEEFL